MPADISISDPEIDARGAAAPVAATVEYSLQTMTGFGPAISDLRRGLAMHRVWRAFAWNEIQNRYRRSALGLAWIFISFLLFVGVITIFFGEFSALGTVGYLSYAAVGFTAFNLIMDSVRDGCHVFRASASWIKSASLPYSIYVYKSLARSMVPFVIQLGTALALMIALGAPPGWGALAAIPAFIIILINAIWIQLLFGLVAARWRDMGHLVSAVSRLMFFASPIIWVYGEGDALRNKAASLNPLTHYIEIFRAPILGDPVSGESWAVVLACTMIGWAVALGAASQMRRRLPFWM